MTAKADTWMPLYIATYLRKTMHLSRDQHGGYMLLLMACWDGGGRLPNNPSYLAGITKSSPSEWKKLAPVLLPYFEIDGDFIVQSRVVKEHQKAARLSEVRSRAGSNGGRPPKQPGSKPKPIGFQEGKQTGTPLQEPIGSTLERSETIVSSLSPGKPDRERAKATTMGPIPDGFPSPSDTAKAEGWITEAGVELNAATTARRFADNARTMGRRAADWDAAWRQWVGIECDKAPAKPVPASEPGPFTWPGPPDLWADVVKRQGEAWARVNLGACDFHDGELTTSSPTTEAKIRCECSADLSKHRTRLTLTAKQTERAA